MTARKQPWRCVALAAAALAAGWASPAAGPARAAQTVVAQVDALTPIATQDGWLAWSERAGAGAFRLVLRAPDGTLRRPAIRTRSVPFDVDLGIDGGGRLVAAYSRCAKEPIAQLGYPTPSGYDTGRECAPYLLDVRGGRERRVRQADAPGASEVWPSPWRDRLAFERVYAKDPGVPVIYVGRSRGTAHSVRQAGGPTSKRSMSASGLELRGDRLAFAWEHDTGGEGPGSQIRLDAVDGAGRRVASQSGGGITQVQLGWPAFSGRWLTWSRECFGDPGGCPGRYGLERAPLAGGPVQRARGPRFVISHDADPSATYLLGDGAGCIGQSERTPCELVRLTSVFG